MPLSRTPKYVRGTITFAKIPKQNAHICSSVEINRPPTPKTFVNCSLLHGGLYNQGQCTTNQIVCSMQTINTAASKKLMFEQLKGTVMKCQWQLDS